MQEQGDEAVPDTFWSRFTRSLRRFRKAITNTCRWRRHRRREGAAQNDGADALQVTGVMMRGAPNQPPVAVVVPMSAAPERPPRPMTLSRARCSPRIPTLLAIEQALDDVKKNTVTGDKDDAVNKVDRIEIPGDTKPSLEEVERNEENEDWEVWDMEVEVEATDEQISA